ncbi:MAG: response regulator receiver protein, partial [Atopobiaceae bacterium]|nr:response regulator receiver protein [Atopobiaceae bacterium]
DYQRLSLRFARTIGGQDPFRVARELMSFPRRYRSMRDSLPQTDQDRAFHLVARATEVIDYRLPFATDDEVVPLADEAIALLDEALELDPANADARRMREVAGRPSFTGLCSFLEENRIRVLRACEDAQDSDTEGLSGEDARLAADIAMRPYLRWLAMQASRTLICGRYREAARIGEQLLSLVPHDPSDVRFTLALAYAKLEDEAALDSLEKRTQALSLMRGGTRDPWMLLSRAALAHRQRRFPEGERLVRELVDGWPNAIATLTRQDELPDGVFARILVPQGSEDELILALSESVVLLQEGREVSGRGSFGAWVSRTASAIDAERGSRSGDDAPAAGADDAMPNDGGSS